MGNYRVILAAVAAHGRGGRGDGRGGRNGRDGGRNGRARPTRHSEFGALHGADMEA